VVLRGRHRAVAGSPDNRNRTPGRAHLPVRDAVHAAVMARHGVRLIVTADRHFEGVPGVVRVDPGGWS